LGLVNLSNLTSVNTKLAAAGEKMRRRLRAMGRRGAGYLLKVWEDATVEGAGCYMRRPGERMPPPPPPRGGPAVPIKEHEQASRHTIVTGGLLRCGLGRR